MDEDNLMEEECDEKREKILGFRPQSETIYNNLLPYSSEIDNESSVALSLIKYNLPRSVLAKELRPGVTHWSKQLLKYIRLYGLKFSKEDHILFVKLYIELITMPNVEGSLLEIFFPVLLKLLKKRKLLSRSDLVIEWRPLYGLAKRLLDSKWAEAGLEWFPSSLDSHLKSVISTCSVYFPSNSTQEMLDVFKPLLCPYDMTVIEGLKYMDWFLPTMAVSEEERDLSWRLWFKELFNIWESIHNGPSFELNLIVMFGRLALHNIGHIDWAPHCDKIFTRLLRIFRLPVGKQNNVAMVSLPGSLLQDAIPRWIVAMLGGPSSGVVLDHIAGMFKAMESYYYPSNHGYWTPSLLSFLSSLCYKFVYRIHKERYKKETWHGQTPESHKLTDSEITRFVEIVKPATFLALYSKHHSTSPSRTIQLLANIRPELILPDLLEKSYTALETLTEPHQLKGCLSALVTSMRAVMRESKWYSEGRAHVIPILFRALPTIDSNDMPKSMAGINFITTCFSLMPIADCSDAVSREADLSERLRNLCLATTELPDFVILFLDRVFTLIESFNREHSTQAVESGNDVELKWSMMEGVIMGGIGASVAVILNQSSPEIYRRSLDKIFQFMASRILDGAGSLGTIMHVCGATARANPELASKKFIPYFTREIIGLFEENPGLQEEEKVDNQLHWYLVVLSGICKHSGKFVLEYKEQLLEALRLTLEMKAKRGYQQAAGLAGKLLYNLTRFYETDHSSLNPSAKNEKLPVYNWGHCISPRELETAWHIPSEEEINFAFDILDEFLQAELKRLKGFAAGEEDLTKDELMRSLTIVNELIVGAGQLIPLADDKPVEIKGRKNVSNLTTWQVKTLSYLTQYEKVVEERSETTRGLRQDIFETARATLWKIMDTKEDDVKSISMIITIYCDCLSIHDSSQAEFDKHWQIYMNGKRAMRDLMRGGKKHQRLLIINRVVLQHQLRTFANRRKEYRQINHDGMTDLVKLSMSHYSAVRIQAQRAFFRALKGTPYKSEEHFLPLVLEALTKDPVEDHKLMKGAFHLMFGEMDSRSFGTINPEDLPSRTSCSDIVADSASGKHPYYLAYFHEWDVISQTWPAILKAMKSDRPSMVKLYEKISVKIQTTYSTIAIHVEVSDGSAKAASNLLTSSSAPNVDSVRLSGVEERCDALYKENLRLYEKLVSDMLQLLETGPLSWIQRNFGVACINFIIRWDVPLPSRVTRFVTAGLVDDTLLFRQLCISPVTSILKKQERKRKIVYKSPEEISGVPVNRDEVLPGDRPDNKIMQYDSANLPNSAEKYDSTIFIEKTHWSYYQWPSQLKTYALNDESYELDRTIEEMPDGEKEIFNKFMDPSFVKLLLKYHALENIKGRDKYDAKKVELFKGVFRNFGDSILPLFQSEIGELAKDPQESSQRCVAEFVSGLVIGSKHWTFEKVEALWKWLLPLLETARDNVSAETQKDWFTAYGHITQNRDPRKLHWFLEFLVKDPINGKGGSYMDGARLYLLMGGIRQQEWRVAELMHRILADVEPKLDHQYKIVRDKLGSTLATIFLPDCTLLGNHGFYAPKRDAFIKRVFQRLSPLLAEANPPVAVKSDTDTEASSSRTSAIPNFGASRELLTSLSPAEDLDSEMEVDIPQNVMVNIQHGLQKILSDSSFAHEDKKTAMKEFLNNQLMSSDESVDITSARNPAHSKRLQNSNAKTDVEDMDSEDSIPAVDKERNSAIRLLKTLMKFIISGQRSSFQPNVPCVWKLLPLICKMSPVDTQGPDEELHHDTQRSLSCLAQSYCPPEQLVLAMEIVQEISGLSSWHARYTVLKFLQIFIYNNLFTLKQRPRCVAVLREVILKLIADEQLEVREMATKTLGGLLQCGFLKIDENLKQFIDCNRKIRVKQKKREKQQEMGKAEYQKKLRSRHSGVLALSACILSNSYSIPDYLPDLLMDLSNHLHDPQPIESTVKKTFSEFRRTHHDSWHLDKLKFTDDQLCILTDLLVSPCYYA